MTRINDMIHTALMIDQVSHDVTIMEKVMLEAESMIGKKMFKEAETILRDGFTYENWRDKFGAQILTGIAYCQLMQNADTVQARETLAPLTEAQVKDTMPEGSYYHGLIYMVD